MGWRERVNHELMVPRLRPEEAQLSTRGVSAVPWLCVYVGWGVDENTPPPTNPQVNQNGGRLLSHLRISVLDELLFIKK